MSITPIFTTRKLEKTIKGFISKEEEESNEFLGSWVFPNIRKADLENISTIFKEAFYAQLIYDGILVDYELIENIIGDVGLYETNNDRSSLGILNYCLDNMEDWKNQFQTFENMPFRDLNNRLNRIPYSFLNLRYPKEEMSSLIQTF